MARSDRDLPREDDGPRGAARFLARPLLLAVIVFLLVVAFTWFLSGRSDTMLPAEVQPSGAGTEPKGITEQDTGSTSQPVDAGEVIDNSSRSDNRPNILDAGDGPTTQQD